MIVGLMLESWIEDVEQSVPCHGTFGKLRPERISASLSCC